MKGIIFIEFIDMVEYEFLYELVDKIIIENLLFIDGVYMSVGNYDNKELIMLVILLSKYIDKFVDEFVYVYGKYLLGCFFVLFLYFFKNVSNIFDFFDIIDCYVYIEVKKLYSDVELLSFWI